MNREYYTVKQIAKFLNLHEKTVQRYIREGLIKAQKFGKSWRVNEEDLNKFTGEATNEPDEAEDVGEGSKNDERVMVSAVVDIDNCDKDEAIRICNTLTALLNSKSFVYGKSTMHTQYIETERKLRLMLWGQLQFMENMINAVSALVN